MVGVECGPIFVFFSRHEFIHHGDDGRWAVFGEVEVVVVRVVRVGGEAGFVDAFPFFGEEGAVVVGLED